MNQWKLLNLSRCDSRPAPGLLVALRMVPTKEKATFYSREKYDIGRFWADGTTVGRKLWWHGTRGTEDPVKLKSHYEIWWCIIPQD